MIKARLDRVAVTVKDSAQAAKDLSEMLGIEVYGPFNDEVVGLKVALPKAGGLELFSPLRDDDKVGATQKLAAKGEGISGIALRVDNLMEAEEHLATFGLTPDARIDNGKMREILYFAQEKTHGIEIALNEFPDESGCGLAVAQHMGLDINELI